MYSRILALTLSITCIAAGLGDVTVREWSGISGTKFQVTEDPNDPNVVEIRILESDSGTFSFEAFYTGTNSAADIDLVETDPSGVTGTVRLKVEADPNYPAREYGARTVKAIDLSTADTGEIAGGWPTPTGWGRDFLPERPSCRSTLTPVSGNLATIAAWRRA